MFYLIAMHLIETVRSTLANYKRVQEPAYAVSDHIHEFYNTLTNIGFILIGVARLWKIHDHADDVIIYLYVNYIFLGIGSGIHHAINHKYSIVIDWIPISFLIFQFLYYGVLHYVDLVGIIQFLLAIIVLFIDHFKKLGTLHPFWHLLAAFALDTVLYSIYLNHHLSIRDLSIRILSELRPVKILTGDISYPNYYY
jgi:hypothetical protein